jgi:hypothetical protein
MPTTEQIAAVVEAMRREVVEDESRAREFAGTMFAPSPEVAALYRMRAQSTKIWANTLEASLAPRPRKPSTISERLGGRAAWIVTFPLVAIAWYVLGACSFRAISDILVKSAAALEEFDW